MLRAAAITIPTLLLAMMQGVFAAGVFTYTVDPSRLNASNELSGVTLPQSGTPTNLSQNNLTYTDFAGTLDLTISADGSRNLAARNYGSGVNNIHAMGIIGEFKDDEVSNAELLTVSASETFSISELVLTNYGNNDQLVLIGGLASDPGTLTFSSFDAAGAADTNDAWATSYDAGADVLTIDITGFASTTYVSFQNSVDTTSFTFKSTSADIGAGGVGFGGFSSIPEPSSLLLGVFGGFLLLRRRRLPR